MTSLDFTQNNGRFTAKKPVKPRRIRYDLFFQDFPEPSYLWQYRDGNFYLVDHNVAGGAAIQGMADQLSQSGLTALYPERNEIFEYVQQCFESKSRFSQELPGYRLRSTGEVRDLVVTFVFGEPDLVLTVFKDITAERAAINELKRLSNAVEQTADAVFITDRTGVIEYVNPAFEKVTGYSRDEVLGNTPRILKSGEMTPGYYQQLWKTILGGEAFQAQTVNLRRDGTRLVVEQTITPMKDQYGQITHFVSLLKDMTERIRYQEKETEHRLAGKVQQGLFPKHSPNLAGYDLAGTVFPASNTSGDYFDYLPMLENTYGVVVGDVCGHGMGAALIMAEVRAYLRSIARYVSNPQAVLTELNDQMFEDLAENGFVTMILARLDPRRHLLEYANAGNWPAYILDAQGTVTHELWAGGIPIGLERAYNLQQSTPIPLTPGSLVVLMTDGIPETRDISDKEFGIERMLSIIKKYHLAPASEIVQRVHDEVLKYSGVAEQADDQTLVILKRVN